MGACVEAEAGLITLYHRVSIHRDPSLRSSRIHQAQSRDRAPTLTRTARTRCLLTLIRRSRTAKRATKMKMDLQSQ